MVMVATETRKGRRCWRRPFVSAVQSGYSAGTVMFHLPSEFSV